MNTIFAILYVEAWQLSYWYCPIMTTEITSKCNTYLNTNDNVLEVLTVYREQHTKQ